MSCLQIVSAVISRILFILLVQTEEINKVTYYTQSDFRFLAKQDYFIDKTLLLKYVYPKTSEETGRVLAFLAPRRMGKSVNLNMIQNFFGAQCDEWGNILPRHKTDYHDTFRNLKIATQERDFANAHFARYPVILLNLATYRIRADDMESLRCLASAMYKQHAYLAVSKRLNTRERDYFNETIHQLQIYNRGYPHDAPQKLVKLLKKHHGRSVIMLYDEMDAPSLMALLGCQAFDEAAAKSLENLGSYFHPLGKGNTDVLLSVFTGTTRIGGTWSFDTNGINYISVFENEEIASFYGYFEEDVQSTAKKLNRLNMVDDMRFWYNGYQIPNSTRTVYNTLSVSAAFQTGVIQSYWDAGNGLEHLKGLFSYKCFGKYVEASFANPLEIELKPEVSKQSLLDFKALLLGKKQDAIDKSTRHLFFQYLLEQGYYTVSKTVVKTPGEHKVEIRIPNLEIHYAFMEKVFNKKFFLEKFSVDFCKINDYVTALINLDGTAASFKRLKHAVVEFFNNKMPSSEAEMKANLYFMAEQFEPDIVELVRYEKFIKMSQETRKEKGSKNKLGPFGYILDLLITLKGNSTYPTDEHIIAIIIEPKFVKERAYHGLVQIADRKYFELADIRKSEVKNQPKTIILVGLSWTPQFGWEMCALYNTTNMANKINVI